MKKNLFILIGLLILINPISCKKDSDSGLVVDPPKDWTLIYQDTTIHTFTGVYLDDFKLGLGTYKINALNVKFRYKILVHVYANAFFVTDNNSNAIFNYQFFESYSDWKYVDSTVNAQYNGSLNLWISRHIAANSYFSYDDIEIYYK